MKKLIMASAVAAVAVAGVASASMSPFVRADLGYTTNSVTPYGDIAKLAPNTFSAKHKKAVVGNIAVGSDLLSLGNQVKLGAELDATYAFMKPTLTVTKGKKSLTEKLGHYAIDPMAYIAFQATSQLTLEAKAGYGYQHYSVNDEGDSIKVAGNQYTAGSSTDGHWAPVVAAELGYAINDRMSVRVGDRYTFGHNYSTLVNQASNAADTHYKTRSNVAYVGIQYNF